jgi:exosortase
LEVALTTPAMWVLRTVIVVGLGLAYAPTAREMIRIWQRDTYAGHCIFVPIFSAFLLWSDRERLRNAAGKGSPAGVFVLLAGLALLVFGQAERNLTLQALSLVVTVAGATLWGFGSRCLREAWFPIAFLALSMPLPRAIVRACSYDLQLFAARFAAFVVTLLGTPIHRRGLFLELPSVTLEVAEICNGLRFMSAMLVLTVAFAQMTQRTAGAKIGLVLAAPPLAVLANGVRVVALALGAEYIGPQAVTGILHHSIGKVVWLLAIVPMVALGFILRRRDDRRRRLGHDQ